MGLKNSTDLSSQFISKIDSLDITRSRMDKLFFERKIFKNDINHVYEGMFLKAVTAFESYIERLFIGLLQNEYKLPTRKRVTKVVFDNRRIATDIVSFGQPYADWLPFEKLKKRAELFYLEGKPFTDLDPNDKNILAQVMAIRNAIAHKSSYSDKIFCNRVTSVSPGLPLHNQTPAGYLRYVFRSGPDQTKFQNYMFDLSNIATKIASYS